MLLSDLIEENGKAQDLEITGLSSDSRAVHPGYLFAALAGTATDGARFIADAVNKGAVAVLASPDVDMPGQDVYRLTAVNPRRRFASIVARFYGPQPGTIAAVTGTNGKTSVASFMRQIWQQLGYPAASIGTLGVMADGYEIPGGLTTPDPVTLHKTLSDLKARGIEHVACEASSHGLAQYRLDGLQIRAAAFTNLTRDHMDYHGTEEDYFFSKARLFGDLLRPGGTAVLNMDDPHAAELESLCWARGHRIIRVGTHDGDLRLLSRVPEDGGQALTIGYEGTVYDIQLPLAGGFQAQNALVAAALAMACGAEPQAAIRALQHLTSVPGRLELAARHPSGASIYVDYAHTPDALSTVLTALRPHVRGKLALVFGCGGDRDRGKRPLMGDIAAALADRVYVTDDNPRSEDPDSIRAAILAAVPTARDIADRRAAIQAAVSDLEAGDILVVAGKGHEQGQIIGTEVRDFNDLIEVQTAVAGIGGRS
ncbi:UDP-N-acetylmuramoyl-L-alanyl-D-glutamate--2,6-diaminopimelate ligase [Govanella unica]|uniref:UDP-N-acetylmuramoyl-L-alanyl-D-glutamate--2,6-diaminopimelate ligase n=1 Tax=Govanella unica TaxID=2975056 RepID=A0A9X3U0C7_9PROT|nr:UDP-N-acetylmuramoyl-L-alanyl-D-glutamate--2,6-diaminopimelate ligase [Govania unica]MDA5195073.1 UDP-N-acetylmuramoyl-L-alanyl-D-glutamate--2,6-diaminopimelate ligase [Govania unica]